MYFSFVVYGSKSTDAVSAHSPDLLLKEIFVSLGRLSSGFMNFHVIDMTS